MNHYPHHIGDFNNATRHLTRVERSLYRDLLDLYYDTERQLPNDIGSLARRILCSTEDRPALETVLQEFFVLDVDGFHNARCDKEIASFQAMAEGGKRGAAKRWGKGLDSHPIATPSKGQCQPEPEPEPEPVTKKEITPLPPTGVAPLKPKATKRCPADFLVTTELQRWAREHAALVDIRAETGIFRDTEFAKAHSDWSATWRAWMAKEQRRHAESAKRDSRRSNVTDLETPKMRAERIRAEEISPLSARRKPTEDGPVQPFVTTIDMEPAYARLERD